MWISDSKYQILEEKLLHHLMIQAYFTKDISLYYGKMGLSICFFVYGRYLKEKVFDDIASDLLDSVWENTDRYIPLDFETGLCGIGWGVGYLMQEGFVCGDINEICEEIDKQIISINLKRLDKTSEFGKGVILYIQSRIKVGLKLNGYFPFDEDFIRDYYRMIETKELSDTNLIGLIKKDIFIDRNSIASNSIGLNNGIGGFLLSQIKNLR